MRKTKDIMLFGFKYRMTQLTAAKAFDRILVDEDDLLTLLDSVSMDGVVLDSAAVINELVKDKMDIMQPRMVLKSLVNAVNDFNFSFLDRRKPPRLPSYLRPPNDSYVRDEDDNSSPVLGVLISEGKATLKELEEYYSLEDAFKLYDIIFAEKLMQAEAQYAAKRR